MAKQFLDAPQVCASFEKMGRKRMSQRVRRDTAAGRKPETEPRNQSLNISRVKASSVDADKGGLMSAGFDFVQSELIPFAKICRHRTSRKTTKRNNPFFPA